MFSEGPPLPLRSPPTASAHSRQVEPLTALQLGALGKEPTIDSVNTLLRGVDGGGYPRPWSVSWVWLSYEPL